MVFNGHKKIHARKFRFVVAPNGLTYLAQWRAEDMKVVCWVTQVCNGNFKNTHMVLMEISSVYIVIQLILSVANI